MHLIGYPEEEKKEKKQICQCLKSGDSTVSGKVCGVQVGFALRWNKVIDCRDRIGRVGRLCK